MKQQRETNEQSMSSIVIMFGPAKSWFIVLSYRARRQESFVLVISVSLDYFGLHFLYK